jgi:hypothetical protein
MNKRNNILSFPDQNSFVLKRPNRTSSGFNNFVSDAGTYAPVAYENNVNLYNSYTELGKTPYKPADYLIQNNGESPSGGGGGGGNNGGIVNGGIINGSNPVNNTKIDSFINPINNNTQAVLADGELIGTKVSDLPKNQLKSGQNTLNSATENKKAFPWLPIIIGAAVLVAAGGVYMLVKK